MDTTRPSATAAAPRHAGADRLARALDQVGRRGDVLMGGMVIAVIALMVLPVPTFLLDAFIAMSIAAGVGLLALSFYVPSALALATFPSLLLFTTMFRLSLNIASTKQILLKANAGHLIDAFGHLVVGGNVVVGLVVFLIIAIVQFIVIAKGAERIAEVGARFTLDAMPGKQMSIDADLRANLIDKAEARRRRTELELESKLHGALDGAMKFVKGDAIAAMIIAFVNIVAGMAIGMAMRGLTLADAASTYTVLSVGDGMVSQIPSLFVSIAAGIMITRIAPSEGASADLGRQVMREVLNFPAALIMCGAVLACFAAVPGFPHVQFLLLATAALGFGSAVRWVNRRPSPERTAMPAMARDGARAVPRLFDDGVPEVAVPLTLRVATSVRDVLDPQRFNDALERERVDLRRTLGVPFPGLRLRHDDTLPEGFCGIDVQEVEVCRHDLSDAARAGDDGLASAITTRLAEAVRAHAQAFIGSQEVQALFERAAADFPELVSEVQRAVPISRIAEVLRRLVQEAVPVRHLREICESLVTWGPREQDIVMLTEYVRVDLARVVTRRFIDAQHQLHAVLLDPDTEAAIRAGIQQGAGGGFISLPQDTIENIVQAGGDALAAVAPGQERIVITAMDVRRYVKKLLDPEHGPLTVLSMQELPSHVRVVAASVIAHAPQARAA